MWCASAGASSGDLTVRTAVKRFQAVVHWAKFMGSRLVFCCLPAFSAAGSWLVCCSISDVDGAQGFGLRSSCNSMNWFAQIFSLTLTGMCAAMGVEALTKNDCASALWLWLPVRRDAAASRTCAVTLSGEWYWSGTCPGDMWGAVPVCTFGTGPVAGGNWPVMGALITAFWTAGPSGAWAAKLGSTAVGGGGSALGGVNRKAKRSSIRARTRLAMLSMTASDTGGVGSGRAGPDAAMLAARPRFAFCIAWATPAEALRFGGICTEQINGSILTPCGTKASPSRLKPLVPCLREFIFSLHYFCSLRLWYGLAAILPYFHGNIWKGIASPL